MKWLYSYCITESRSVIIHLKLFISVVLATPRVLQSRMQHAFTAMQIHTEQFIRTDQQQAVHFRPLLSSMLFSWRPNAVIVHQYCRSHVARTNRRWENVEREKGTKHFSRSILINSANTSSCTVCMNILNVPEFVLDFSRNSDKLCSFMWRTVLALAPFLCRILLYSSMLHVICRDTGKSTSTVALRASNNRLYRTFSAPRSLNGAAMRHRSSVFHVTTRHVTNKY